MGFTRAGPIGVDIEYCHPLPATSGVIAKALSTKEYRHYQATPTTCREALFYAAWTLKEAGVKATGKGLSGLEEIDLNISATAGKASLRAIGGHVANPGGWYSRTFAAVKGFASAVVVEGDPKSCYLYTIGGID